MGRIVRLSKGEGQRRVNGLMALALLMSMLALAVAPSSASAVNCTISAKTPVKVWQNGVAMISAKSTASCAAPLQFETLSTYLMENLAFREDPTWGEDHNSGAKQTYATDARGCNRPGSGNHGYYNQSYIDGARATSPGTSLAC